MATTYQLADDEVTDLLGEVINEHHKALAEAGVKVAVVMALNPDGPGIKHGGYPALAKIKVVSLRDRVTKSRDAELLIDEREWNELRHEHRLALLDHELSHLTLVMLPPDQLRSARANDPEAPAWALDDLGRPRLKTVLGDWNPGDGFSAVCERHGEYAIEFLNLSRAWARAKAAAGECEPAGSDA